jgi:tetratricopeptide (TPR) repeat protein
LRFGLAGSLAALFVAGGLLLDPKPSSAESTEEEVARLHEKLLHGDASTESWRKLAHGLASKGELAGAEAALLTGLKQDPHSAPTLRDLGTLYIETNRTSKAKSLLEQALSLDPDDPETREALSYVLYQSGDAVRSLEIANRGEPLGPAQAEALVEAARFYTESGQPEAAQRALAKAQELAPKSLGVSSALLRHPEPSDAAQSTRASGETESRFAGTLATVLGLVSLGALLAAAVSLVLSRGKGDLVVTIEYPEELKGSFTVRLSRRPSRALQPGHSLRESTPEPVSSRFEHLEVIRETQFRNLSPRRWFVTIEGALGPEGVSFSSRFRLEQEVWVERDRVAEACFELHEAE